MLFELIGGIVLGWCAHAWIARATTVDLAQRAREHAWRVQRSRGYEG